MLDDLTISELCQEIRNYFDLEKHNGHFVIENGNITADFLRDGQYFRIMGSVFSDGVHKYPAMSPFTSESFAGYSYSKGGAGGSGSSGGSGATGWKAAFASRLNAWRKLHE